MQGQPAKYRELNHEVNYRMLLSYHIILNLSSFVRVIVISKIKVQLALLDKSVDVFDLVVMQKP